MNLEVDNDVNHIRIHTTQLSFIILIIGIITYLILYKNCLEDIGSNNLNF